MDPLCTLYSSLEKSAAKLAEPLLFCSARIALPHCLIFLERFFLSMKASRLLLINSYGYSSHSFVCPYYSSTQSIQLAFKEQCTGGHLHFPFFLTLYCWMNKTIFSFLNSDINPFTCFSFSYSYLQSLRWHFQYAMYFSTYYLPLSLLGHFSHGDHF